ncbi:MAG: hypothetical protein AB1458_16775 [Bacteroidota bacterium]
MLPLVTLDHLTHRGHTSDPYYTHVMKNKAVSVKSPLDVIAEQKAFEKRSLTEGDKKA